MGVWKCNSIGVVILAVVAAGFVFGCGPPHGHSGDVGNDGALVGGACGNDSNCAPDSKCLKGDRFPDGTCSLDCRDDRDCPNHTRCVRWRGGSGVCLLACGGDGDCRRKYECEDRRRRGHGGETDVCID